MITRIFKYQLLALLAMGLFMTACDKEEITSSEEVFTEDFTVTERGLVFGPEGRPLQCYQLMFPVTVVFPDGSSQEIENAESLKAALLAWRTDNPEATERPHVAFPYEVELKDGTIATVETMDDVAELRENCRGGRPHSPTKCFRLVYPVTVTLPDGSSAEAESAEALHEIVKAWREANPGVRQRPEIAFPYEVQLRNGETVLVEGPQDLRGLPFSCRTRPLPQPRPCFQLLFPVTVVFPGDAGETVEAADNIALARLLRDWAQRNPGAVDRPELLFPYDVRLRNGTVATVESEEDVQELLDNCRDDRPNRPKCFRMTFPITLEFPGGRTETVENRLELHRTLVRWKRLFPNAPRPEVTFPFTVVFRDGTTATVQNREELAALRDACPQ